MPDIHWKIESSQLLCQRKSNNDHVLCSFSVFSTSINAKEKKNDPEEIKSELYTISHAYSLILPKNFTLFPKNSDFCLKMKILKAVPLPHPLL